MTKSNVDGFPVLFYVVFAMDELVGILDSDGNATGRTAPKSEAHKNGWFHPTVHIWFYTLDGRILIQQRAKNKDTHPLLWDVSVAGHVGAGKKIEKAAVREVREEIGLDIDAGELRKISVVKGMHEHSKNLKDFEFHHVYLCELKKPLSSLQKQDSEVSALALIPLIQFAQETWGLANPQKYVPHGIDYYKMITEAIKNTAG